MPSDQVQQGPLKTTEQVATAIGVTRQTLIRYLDAGHFPNAHKLPGGLWRIPQTDIDAFLDQCRAAASSTPRLTTQATDIVTT